MSDKLDPGECVLCVEHFPRKRPHKMELNGVRFACDRQHSREEHISRWPIYATVPKLLRVARYAAAVHVCCCSPRDRGEKCIKCLAEEAIRECEL